MSAPAPEPLPGADDGQLLLRVLSALLREDVAGLRSRGRLVTAPDGCWLRLATGPGRALLLPVRDDGFQSRYAARLPLLRREPEGVDLATTDDVLAALADLVDPADRPGFRSYAEECREAQAAIALHQESRPATMTRLSSLLGQDPARWDGLPGGLGHDALAARHDHPVYPTSRGRAGLAEPDLRAFAPEFHPRFDLRWLLLPRERVAVAGTGQQALPGLPGPADLGHARLADSHVALPVHPLTVGAPLDAALHESGLHDSAVLARRPAVAVVPTLSMRTVALAERPTDHLKLPLSTSTLGLRNRRSIKPGTLTDGAAGERLLREVLAREPRLRARVLLADESHHAHAGHEVLAVLLRRYPAGLDDSAVVPLAALTARAPDGRLLVEHHADRFYGGDPVALLDAMLTLLFDLQVTLFTYGVALESHQQNVSLVLSERQPPRLLLKDNDGPRVNPQRLRVHGLAGHCFDDPRTYADDDGLADLFVTITLHLCAGAFAFGWAEQGLAPLDRLLGLVRERLAQALDRAGTAYLRGRTLEAPELPVKAMVSAGTLLSKERSGAADVNKHYTTGPNYLRTGTT